MGLTTIVQVLKLPRRTFVLIKCVVPCNITADIRSFEYECGNELIGVNIIVVGITSCREIKAFKNNKKNKIIALCLSVAIRLEFRSSIS